MGDSLIEHGGSEEVDLAAVKHVCVPVAPALDLPALDLGLDDGQTCHAAHLLKVGQVAFQVIAEELLEYLLDFEVQFLKIERRVVLLHLSHS